MFHMTPSHHSPTILVAGATGILGSEICRQLTQNNHTVKGLVRPTSDPGKISSLRAMGVETVVGDLKEHASLKMALKEVSSVISTVSSTLSRQEGDSIQTVDEEGQINLINAAIEAEVKHFIFISVADVGDSPLQAAKKKGEKHLMASGLNYTILKPTCFMEIWLSPALGFNYAEANATIYGEGNNRVSWISLRDVASFAVAVLDNPIASNRILELGGPEALSPLEVVDLFSSIHGKLFELQFVSEEVLKSQIEAADDPLSKTFASLMLGVASGNEIDMRAILDDFPLQLITVRDYAADVASA
jgi:uncharacterized protein YbjT (DUF2867 family)